LPSSESIAEKVGGLGGSGRGSTSTVPSSICTTLRILGLADGSFCEQLKISMQPACFRPGPKHGCMARSENGPARTRPCLVPARCPLQAVLGLSTRHAVRHGPARFSRVGPVGPGKPGGYISQPAVPPRGRASFPSPGRRNRSPPRNPRSHPTSPARPALRRRPPLAARRRQGLQDPPLAARPALRQGLHRRILEILELSLLSRLHRRILLSFLVIFLVSGRILSSRTVFFLLPPSLSLTGKVFTTVQLVCHRLSGSGAAAARLLLRLSGAGLRLHAGKLISTPPALHLHSNPRSSP